MNSLEPQVDPHGFVENMNWLWTVEDDRLNSSKVLLLAVLINFAGNGQTCWPGQTTLAKRARMSESTVRRLLADLERDGFISREHRQRPDGSRTSDLVTLHLIQPLESSARPTAHSERKELDPTAQNKRMAERDQPLNLGGPTTQIERGIIQKNNPEEESSRRAARAASALPREWVPTARHREYAELHGISLKAESDNFRTYFLDGTGATKRHKDWDRAFANWMLRTVQRLQSDGKYRPRLQAVPPTTTSPDADDTIAGGWWGTAPREEQP